MKKGWIVMLMCVCLMMLGGCGNKSMVGEYIGLDAGGTLVINSDHTWTFEQKGDWGSSDIYWEGTWSELEDGAYELMAEDEILYVEKEEDGKVWMYSPGGGNETFRKVD